MSFDPKTGRNASLQFIRNGALNDIAEVLTNHNRFQREKIARGEKPDYDPDAPLPRRGFYQNYP